MHKDIEVQAMSGFQYAETLYCFAADSCMAQSLPGRGGNWTRGRISPTTVHSGHNWCGSRACGPRSRTCNLVPCTSRRGLFALLQSGHGLSLHGHSVWLGRGLLDGLLLDGLHGLLDGLRDGLGLDRVVYDLGVEGFRGFRV